MVVFSCFFFFFKQKTAYEMRISDWSSDVCSSDLDLRESVAKVRQALGLPEAAADGYRRVADYREKALGARAEPTLRARAEQASAMLLAAQPKPALALLQKTLSDASALPPDDPLRIRLEMEHASARSEEHTSELQSLMRISSAGFRLKK